jgi:hypothetical protein
MNWATFDTSMFFVFSSEISLTIGSPPFSDILRIEWQKMHFCDRLDL